MKLWNVSMDASGEGRPGADAAGRSRVESACAFTIIEIAICLGIIGFALVAIIAVLPRGLDVERRNREQTIIGQDAGVWMNALRSGAQGYDDLTNYVLCITNFWTRFDPGFKAKSGTDYYTPSNSSISSPLFVTAESFPLTNGAHIIGLLTMPKLLSIAAAPGDPQMAPLPNYALPPFQSNYIVAYVRAFSGAAVSHVPQTNSTILGDAFIYRMIVENSPYVPVDTNSICMDCLATNGLTFDQMVARTNLAHTIWMLQTNSQDFRLRFRWPVLPNGEIPSYGAVTFRSVGSGSLLVTNDPGNTAQPLFFVQSSSFLQVTNLP